MASRIAVNAISFASSIILARWLMPEDFGLVAMAVGVSAIITSLTSLPISEALVRADNIEDAHFDSAFTLGLARSVILAICLAIAAWPVAWIFNDDRLAPIMFALVVQAFVSGFYSARWPMIQKNLSFGPEATVGLVMRVASVTASLLIAYHYRSYWAIVAPIVLVQILSVALTHLYAPYRPRLCVSKMREIWSFSIWVTFSSSLNAINAKLDSLLIGGILGQRAVGFYSYGEEKANMPTRELSSPLMRVLFPGLAAVKNDPARLASAYKRTQSTIFAVCAPVGVGFALVADMFVHVLLGDKWLPIIPIMQVLAAAFAFENLVLSAAPLAMAMGYTRTRFKYDVAVFASRVPLVLLGLFLAGIPGALGARVIAMLCYLALYLWLAKRIANLPIGDQLKGCWRSIAALSAMALSVHLFKLALPVGASANLWWLMATATLGALLYATAHASLWLISGRPEGPERELYGIASGLLRRKARS